MRLIHTLLLLGTLPALGYGNKPRSWGDPGSTIAASGFEENKGQVRTTSGDAAPFVRYRLTQGNTQLFLLNNGIAYQFSRVHYPAGYTELVGDPGHDRKQLDALRDQVRLETYRMDMTLEGANPSARITTEGRSTDYTQYYNHNALDVHTYTKVTYHDAYPGIDWVVYTTEKGLKYDFVVRPGADPNSIRLRFEHHEELEVNAKGELIHGNRMGRFMEERPVSFQEGREIATRFVLEGNVLRFALEAYDHSRTLTIDPARVWGTYYGGTANDHGHATATDAAGNVYVAGSTFSASMIGSGGHQNSPGGMEDAFLVKFNSAGQRQWASYYGGSGNDTGMGCAADNSGNVFLAGTTNSASGIASGGHQNTFEGQIDAFLVKFNAAGNRVWGTYYGGDFAELGNACAVDATGQVYLAGGTRSYTGIATDGAFQDYHGAEPVAFQEGLDEDAFLAKFSADGIRLWGSYFGGYALLDAGFDRAYSCAVDMNGSAILAGYTSSDDYDFNVEPTWSHQSTPGGESDAFLLKIGSNGALQWATFYGGTGADDGRSCSVDPSGNIFLAGTTASTTAIASGGHQNALGGGAEDAFLVKFDGQGTRLWATYYGGPDLDEGNGCATDAAGNVYLTGQTRSSSGIAAGGHQNTYAGSWDAFLVKLNSSGVRQWGTYYGDGGEFDDWGQACATQGSEFVYMAGQTGSPAGVAANGHQNTHGGNNWDAFLAKFEAAGPEPDCVLSDFTESEPNNVIGEADPLPVDTKIHGSMGACEPVDSSMDLFLLSLPSSGAVQLEVCMYNTGPDAIPVSFQLRTSTGSLVEAFTLQAGPDGGSVTTTYIINCVNFEAHQLRILTPTTSYCTFYGVTWNMLPTVFAADVEPNNSLGTAIPTAYDTYQEGHLAFEGGSPYDFYDFTPPTDGVMTFEVQAEHAGAEADSLELVLWGIETWILPVGANGEPVTSTVSIPCRALTEEYTITLQSFACGTSYRWKYTMSPPLFANDVEPNDSSPGTPLGHDTFTEGHLAFTAGSPYDFFAITPPTNGVMTFEVQAEHVGPEADSLEFHLNGSQTWNIPVGANGVPATSTFSIDCRGNTTTYTARLRSFACGTSYKWKYTMSAPVFANDVEPNNNIAGATAMDLDNGSQYGNIGFHGQTDADYFSFAHPGGPWSVTVSAEHVGTGEGSMTMDLINGAGSNFGAFTVPAGGASTAITSTFELTTLAAGTYLFRISPVTCGVSYLIHCTTDADGDGICDTADLCPGGPEPGTPCDDGNSATVNDAINADCECEGDITTGLSGTGTASDELRLWPNPATDELWIEGGAPGGSPYLMVVRDLMGRVVLTTGPVQPDAQGRIMVRLGSLAQGTYVVELRTNGRAWSRRIVKA